MSLETQIERIAAALESLVTLANGKTVSQTVAPVTPASEQVQDAKFTETPPDEQPAAKKRGRQAKEGTPAPVEAPKKEEAKTVTIEAVRAVMHAVQSVKTAAAAFALITKRGARTLKELPQEKYAEVIAEGNAIVADIEAKKSMEE